ncbi:MAG: hypothetical protein IPJ65_04445 [Archangiaceae bacterium]|nr:hypothetical protein [Archangiaceae bacterium]
MALPALGAEPAWVDARVTSTMQLFQQALVPGLPAAVTRVEPAYPFTVSAFTRFGALGSATLGGAFSGELSAWGRLGPLDNRLGDGDLTAAWVQFTRSHWRVRLGRQITLPGSSRYVRFDGATVGLTFDPIDVQVYGGWVALPRWSQVRGAVLAGFATDALVDPALLEAQNRAGQFTYGARLAARLPVGQLAVGFHEQRDAVGVAYRVVSADGAARPADWLTVGARLTFDLTALAISEARVFADVRTPWLPLAVDYSYQSPTLLLPSTSVLAAFGGLSWHELGAEATWRALQTLKLVGRAAAQLYEGDRPGGRGGLKLTWAPDVDQRLLLLAEAGRALVPPSGFTFARVGARGRLAETVWLSGDGALYVYDQPIRGHSYSLTGIASVEWAPFARVRGLLSATVMTTPYSAYELQGLARVVVELGTVAEGSTP